MAPLRCTGRGVLQWDPGDGSDSEDGDNVLKSDQLLQSEFWPGERVRGAVHSTDGPKPPSA
jgi:hypothetical protein